jgi:hypothetical protein
MLLFISYGRNRIFDTEKITMLFTTPMNFVIIINEYE